MEIELPKHTTRVISERDGTSDLLLSIVERLGGTSQGDLIIYFPHNGFMEDRLSGILEATRENRISVHVSPRSTGHLINGHVNTDKHYNPAAYIELNEDKPFWLIGIFSPMANEEYTPPRVKKSNEEILSIGKYDSTNSTLAYSLWISRTDLPEIDMSGYFVQKDFSYFRVMMMWHHVIVPSLPEGYTSFAATSPRRVDGIPDGSTIKPGNNGYSVRGAQELYMYALQRLSVYLYQIYRRKMMPEGIDVKGLEEELKMRCCTSIDPNKSSDENKEGIYIIADPNSPLFDGEIPPQLPASYRGGVAVSPATYRHCGGIGTAQVGW